jgi:(S)-3,5-dihydroxyphenylglycine transaminase
VKTDLLLKSCLSEPLLGVMNFLNEVILDNPNAISFAPGRPSGDLLDVETHVLGIQDYVLREAQGGMLSAVEVWQSLGQYSKTNGSINAAIASQLRKDEGIHVSPESIMVTVGAQEAMAVVLVGLLEPARDILLVSEPTYVGITGLARILGIRLWPVPLGAEGLTPSAVSHAIAAATKIGRVRALYDIPNFNNPLGVSLSLEYRSELLKVCGDHGVLYLEDNAYGMFAYDGNRLPALKSIDAQRTVLYIQSYSKILFPSLRVGCLVADQKVGDKTLAQELSKVKSLITVNSSGISQAIVAHAIQSNGGSLDAFVAPKRTYYKRNRDKLLDCLEREFGSNGCVCWNQPRGGFFLALKLPFTFGRMELETCASDYGVIVCPMSFFSLTGNFNNQVRLSFSSVNEDEIVEGVRRFSQFCHERISQQNRER